MNEQDTGERLTKLETVVGAIERTVARLDEKFDTFVEHLEKRFVLRNEHESQLSQIKELRDEVKELRGRIGKLPSWAASLITFLLSIIGWIMSGHYFHI